MVEIPKTVNVVSTTHLLPQELDPVTKKRRYTIPLTALAVYLPGAQYTPKAFASVICRLREGDKPFTVLYFKSGKCLVVRQKCPEHARYVVQIIRLMLENAPVLVRQPDGTIIQDTLGKYLCLNRWRIENTVLSCNLGMRINLAHLASSAPGKINYTPGNFPGAEFEMRIIDAQHCTCSRSRKCGCKVKVVCFDSGKINIAGLRDATQGNAVFYTLRSLITGYRDEESVVPKEQRFQARIERFAQYLARNAEQRKEKTTTPLKRRRIDADVVQGAEEEEEDIPLDVMDEEIQVLQALAGVEEEQEGEEGGAGDGITHLMRACDKRQVANVRILLEQGLDNVWAVDKDGKTALDRLKEQRKTRADCEQEEEEEEGGRDEDDQALVEHLIALLEVHMKRK
jgi:TATA-box binding protein (TBP) (component of TFIID and TFIIIB)